MLDILSPEIKAFLDAWQENDTLCGSIKTMPETMKPLYFKEADQRTKFIALNMVTGGQTMGHFMVDRKTEMVYSIKGYGKVNLKKPRGKIGFLTEFIKKLTREGKEYTHTFWYALHPIE